MERVSTKRLLAGVAAIALGGMLSSAATASVGDYGDYYHSPSDIEVGSANSFVNGVPVGHYNIAFDPSTGKYSLPQGTVNGPLMNPADPESIPEWSVTYEAAGKWDPWLSYGFTATNNTAFPQDFTFSLAIPIAPTAVLAEVVGSLSGSFTDGTLNGLTVTPLLADMDGDGLSELQVGEVGSGGPLSNMGVDVGLAFAKGAGLPPTGPIPTDLDTDLITTGGPYDVLKATLSFRLSPDSDVASFSGFLSINTIPEPGTAALVLAMGVLGLSRRFSSRG